MTNLIREFLTDYGFQEKKKNTYTLTGEVFELFALINPYGKRLIIAAKNNQDKGIKIEGLDEILIDDILEFYCKYV